jgi:hypothetical protein
VNSIDWLFLEIENFKKITRLEPLIPLKGLEGLAILGSAWTIQIVETLNPIRHLKNLRYLFLSNLRSLDKTLEPVSHLSSLENFRSAYWWPRVEFEMLKESLPNLKYGSAFDYKLIDSLLE